MSPRIIRMKIDKTNDRTIGMGREDRRLVSQGRFLNG